MGGIIVGRSSSSVFGLFVEPGIVDADSQGELFIIAHTPSPPITVTKGQRIAQFVPLPHMAAGITPMTQEPRGQKCLGSSGGIALLAFDLTTRPKRPCKITFQGNTVLLEYALLDTGADSCLIDSNKYPKMWPLLPTNATVSGIGGVRLAKKSPPILVEIDGKTASTVFSLTPLPQTVDCIIGRDVLAQLGFVLTDCLFP